jgi:hypothetical protein
VAFGLVALERRLDLGLRLGAAHPLGTLDGLARLQVLVDLEEVLDLQPVELRHVAHVAQVLQPRVGRRDAEHLVVSAGLVGHPEHPDRAALDQTARERRLLQDHECVERVAVQAQRVLDVAVVRGVLGRGEQRPVQTDATGLVVDLVLVALTLGDLHQYVELHEASSDRPCCRAGRAQPTAGCFSLVSRTKAENVESREVGRAGR